MPLPDKAAKRHKAQIDEIFEIFASEIDHTGPDYRVFRNFLERLKRKVSNTTALFHALEKLAPKNSDHLVLLGAFYDLGIGTEENKKKALALYEEAANDDNSRAMYLAGSAYTLPTYGDLNDERAFYFYDKSARVGYSRAKLSVADCHGYGLGTDIYARKCFYWDHECAKDGICETFGMMAHHYLTGYGTEVDVHTAIQWYRKALKSSPDIVTSLMFDVFRISSDQ